MTKLVPNIDELIRSLVENLHSATFYYDMVEMWAEDRKKLKWWEFKKRYKKDRFFIQQMLRLYEDIQVIEIPILMNNGSEWDAHILKKTGAGENLPVVDSSYLFKD